MSKHFHVFFFKMFKEIHSHLLRFQNFTNPSHDWACDYAATLMLLTAPLIGAKRMDGVCARAPHSPSAIIAPICEKTHQYSVRDSEKYPYSMKKTSTNTPDTPYFDGYAG